MDVKEVIDRVRSKLTDEQLSDVGADLEQIKSGYLEKIGEVKAAVAESMERKKKIREMTENVEDLTLDRDDWRKKFESHDDSALIEERDSYKQKWQNHLSMQRGLFEKFYESAKESDTWKKVSDEYKIPEDGSWDKLESSDIENNIEKMNYHKKLGLFDSEQPKPKPPLEKSFKFSDDKVPTVQEYNEIRKQYGPNSYEAKKAMELIQKHK